MDGSIVIGAELSTDKFDKQVTDLERKLKAEEDKKILIETKLDTQNKELEDARKKTDELANAYQRLKSITTSNLHEKAQEYIQIRSTYGSLQEIEKKYNTALNYQEKIEQKATKTAMDYQKISDKVEEYKQKIETVKIEKQVAETNKLKESFNNVGGSIEKTVKKASKLALAIFGIRSAYMLLRRASSDLASYDEQYATNLEYIRWVLTQTIAPVLRWIVSIVATILQYIYAILNAWFGIGNKLNLSAKAFQKMKGGASGTSKAVKEIKKELAGFDEINMLSANGDTGGGGAGGGIASPDFDLGSNVKIPDWLQWIIDNRDLILAILAGMVAGIEAIKRGLGGIKALGIGVLVTGIIRLIQNLIKYLKDPSWENFGKIISDIGLIILGVGVIIGGLPAIVSGVVIAIYGLVVSNWEKIRAKLQQGINWLREKSDWVKEHFGIVGQFIYDYFVNKLQNLLNVFNFIVTTTKSIFDGLINFIKGVYNGGWTYIQNQISQVASTVKSRIIDPIKNLFSQMWENVKNGFTNAYWNIRYTFDNIKNFIAGIVNDVFGFFQDFGENASDFLGNAFKSIINRILSSIENTLNKAISSVNSMISAVNNLPGINIGKLNGVYLPRLATGGIVNMPNKRNTCWQCINW